MFIDSKADRNARVCDKSSARIKKCEPPFPLNALVNFSRAHFSPAGLITFSADRAMSRPNSISLWLGVAILALLLGNSSVSAAPGSGGYGVGYGGSGASSGSNLKNGGNGGGSGGGKVGVSMSMDALVDTSISGSNGAGGTPGNANAFHGYIGGDGGSGLFASSKITIEVGATTQVSGGNGGAGAGGRPGSTGSSGGGGAAGGSGISFALGGTLLNDGVIQGGKGGNGANKWGSYNSATGGGGGGAGVEGANISIVNRGTISGGAGGTGGTGINSFAGAGERGAAINWTGGVNNRLRMETGSVINGALWIQANAAAEIIVDVEGLDMKNAFIFDGAGLIDTQDNDLVISGVVSGLGSLEKAGDGVLTLSGKNLYKGGTVIRGGTISTSADANLGATASALEIDGGTVKVTSSYDMTRTVSLGLGGGTFFTDSNTTLTMNGTISDSLSGVSGGLTKTGDGQLVLTALNTYTGNTDIKEGVVALSGAGNFSVNGALNLLGSSSAVDISLASGSQTIGSLSGVAGTNLNLGANSLTFGDGNDFIFAGGIEGTGALTKKGNGTQVLAGVNTYTGGTMLEQGRLYITNGSALGAGLLAMSEDTALGFSANDLILDNDITLEKNLSFFETSDFSVTLAGVISGDGGLAKSGGGTLFLNGVNNYKGSTVVSSGQLQAGAIGALSNDSDFMIESGAAVALDGFSQTVAAVNNNGTVSLLGSTPGTTLTVLGRWEGNDGVLRLGTGLNDSASISDRLILDGSAAVATGTTNVYVANLSGLGAQTQGDGIEIISARNGAITSAQTTADAFLLVGEHVDAGAFEYRLFAADADGLGESWFLRSTKSASVAPAYRRETLLYAALPAQFRQADQAMLGSLHQRAIRHPVGDEDSAGVPYQAWGRIINADRTISQSGVVSPTSSGRFSGFQVGSDLLGHGNWRIGTYVGRLDGSMGVSGQYGDSSKSNAGANKIQSQYVGAYGTWRNSQGAYVDTAVQQGFHRYSSKASGNAAADSKSGSSTVSIEVGQSVPLTPSLKIEPQLQFMHQSISASDARIAGAKVQLESPAGWTGRAGLRLTGEINTDVLAVQPYTQINVYMFDGGSDVARFIGPAGSADIKTRRSGSSSEVVLGASVQLSPKYSVYAELGQRWSLGDKTQIEGALNGSVGASMRW